MKKCPFCAEDIQNDAIKCKHCGSTLSRPNVAVPPKEGSAVMKKNGNKTVLWVVLLVIAILFWFISVPVIAGWLIWKKASLSRRHKVILIALVASLFYTSLAFGAYRGRKPTLNLIEPAAGASIQADKTTLRGRVDPPYSSVTVGSKTATVEKGTFFVDVDLTDEDNNFVLVAKNGSNITEVSVVIHRLFTEQEKAAIEKRMADEKAAAEAAEEKRKADLAAEQKAAAEQAKKAAEAQAAAEAAWRKTKAGKICTAHPEWQKEDCLKLAEGKIWIGMTIEMLVFELGKPNSVNPSNYGRGEEYQYCWTYRSPSCFYDNAPADGIIDSYN